MIVNGYTRTCGLIGNPVEHTMSPVIQTEERRVGKECSVDFFSLYYMVNWKSVV